VNGLSKAFGFVVEGMSAHGWDVKCVDAADRSAPRTGSAFSWGRAGEIAKVLTRAIRQLPEADLVYVTIAQSRWGFAKDVIVLLSASVLRRPTVVHMHGGNFAGFFSGLSGPEQALVRATVSRLSAIVVLTESLRADFRMSPRWQSQTTAIANTCDTQPGSARRHPGSVWQILFLSNLLVSKGYREVIQAVGTLARRRPDLSLRLRIAGAYVPDRDFPDEQAQEADLRALLSALPSNVEASYAGILKGDEKNDLLASSHVFLLPTTYVNEGQPIAVIEALTSGLPVIATDWRGIRETLPDSMHDLLVPTREAAALAAKLELLVDTPALYEQLSGEALRHATAFSRERHLAALDAVFRKALSTAQAGRG
jgi:glycosyltransferase involved in cell wall biosynthesis